MIQNISKAKAETADMTTGPVLLPFIKYTLPIIFSGVLSLLFNTVDMVVVGQFAGEPAVAAVGSTTALIGFVTNLFLGISMGVTVKLATDIGAGEKNLNKTVQTSYTLGILFGLVTCVAGCSFAKNMLVWMNTPKEVLSQATLYLRIYFLGQPGFMLFSFGRAILSAFGDTKSPFYYLTVSGVANVLLNLFFVIVFQMDVAGVAVATVISQFMMAVLLAGKLTRLPAPHQLSPGRLMLEKRVTSRIMHLGIPSGLQTTLFLMSTVLIQSSVNSLDSTSLVAGNSSATSIEGFIYTAMISIAQGCIAFSGQNYGARSISRLRKVYRVSIFLEIAVGASMGALAYIFGSGLLSLFLPDSAVSVQYGLARMSVIARTYFLCGIMDCTTYMIRGMNRTIFPLIATLMGSVVFRIVWIFTVFPWVRSSLDIAEAFRVLLISYPISWIVTFAALLIYYFITICQIRCETGNNPPDNGALER